MQYPVQHSCCKDRIPHHLSPFSYLLVGCEDDRSRLVCIAYESEEAVCLSTADRGVSYLIQNDQLGFAYVLKSEACASLGLCIVEDLDEVSHPLKADCITRVYRFKAEAYGQHRLAKARRPGEDNVSISIYPVEFLQLPDLACRYA